MKSLISTFVLALLASATTMAQSPTASSYIEQTKMGSKFGNYVGVRFNNQFQLGGFYQKDISQGKGSENIPYHLTYEKEFFGMYMSGPLKAGEKFGLDMAVRTGVTNRENFTITPSILGSFKALKIISLNAGLGIRAFRPTAMAGISLNLNSF